MRQIILDTETTGLKPEEGHRIIEIGCLEMIDRRLTGNSYHRYINPEREVDAGAFAVHGLGNDFLKDKPTFIQLVDEFMEFVKGAELIIHNAPFDVSFINHELLLTKKGFQPMASYCGVIDTLQMARQLHVGQRNSLDALCKRYSIDNSKRDLHGALLDANLLAQVYLAMTGGQGSFFDAESATQKNNRANREVKEELPTERYQLTVIAATDDEKEAHRQYLEAMKKKGGCVWLDDPQ